MQKQNTIEDQATRDREQRTASAERLARADEALAQARAALASAEQGRADAAADHERLTNRRPTDVEMRRAAEESWQRTKSSWAPENAARGVLR